MGAATVQGTVNILPIERRMLASIDPFLRYCQVDENLVERPPNIVIASDQARDTMCTKFRGLIRNLTVPPLVLLDKDEKVLWRAP